MQNARVAQLEQSASLADHSMPLPISLEIPLNNTTTRLYRQATIALVLALSFLAPLGHAQSILKSGQRADVPYVESQLRGTYSSSDCDNVVMTEDGSVSNIRRFYNFETTTYTVSYTFFADDTCASPLFTFFFAGPYALGKPRPELGPVREVQVVFDTILMTAESEQGAAILENACGAHGWAPGTTRDVGGQRCLNVQATGPDCIGDYELLMLDGDRLAPGVRSTRMCSPEGRPKSIQSVPVYRVAP